MLVLGIDPGREKCGLAVVSAEKVLIKKVVTRGEFLVVVKQMVKEYNIDVVVLGDGTGSHEFLEEFQGQFPRHAVSIIDEGHSTEEARANYWLDHRPRGWRRLLPSTLQIPPEPYDDYVAVIIAQRYLTENPG